MKDSQLFLAFALYCAIDQKPVFWTVIFTVIMIGCQWREGTRWTAKPGEKP